MVLVGVEKGFRRGGDGDGEMGSGSEGGGVGEGGGEGGYFVGEKEEMRVDGRRRRVGGGDREEEAGEDAAMEEHRRHEPRRGEQGLRWAPSPIKSGGERINHWTANKPTTGGFGSKWPGYRPIPIRTRACTIPHL